MNRMSRQLERTVLHAQASMMRKAQARDAVSRRPGPVPCEQGRM
jgi:hypothetical protein